MRIQKQIREIAVCSDQRDGTQKFVVRIRRGQMRVADGVVVLTPQEDGPPIPETKDNVVLGYACDVNGHPVEETTQLTIPEKDTPAIVGLLGSILGPSFPADALFTDANLSPANPNQCISENDALTLSVRYIPIIRGDNGSILGYEQPHRQMWTLDAAAQSALAQFVAGLGIFEQSESAEIEPVVVKPAPAPKKGK